VCVDGSTVGSGGAVGWLCAVVWDRCLALLLVCWHPLSSRRLRRTDRLRRILLHHVRRAPRRSLSLSLRVCVCVCYIVANRSTHTTRYDTKWDISNQIKSNFSCSKHITFKCSKWQKQLMSRANKAQKSTYSDPYVRSKGD